MNHIKYSILLIFLSVSLAQGQSAWKLFKEDQNKAISALIKNSNGTNAYVYEDMLNMHFDGRRPINKLGCAPDSIDFLSLAIYFGNGKITKQLLNNSKYNKNIDLLSQALNAAVYKNDADLFEKLKKLGAKLNHTSALFHGRNTIQIAIAGKTEQKLMNQIIEESSLEDYRKLDCYGNSTLHILVEKNDFYLFKKLDEKCGGYEFSKNEREEFPIEVALRNGNVSIAKSLFSTMSKNRSFGIYSTDENILRLNHFAYKSKNSTIHAFVDSLIAQRYGIAENYLYRVFMNTEAYDLNQYINQADYFIEYYNKLSLLSPHVKESNFNDFLKNFRATFKELTGLNLYTDVKINPFTKLMNFDDLLYLSQFYTDDRWSELSKKDAEGTPLISEMTDPFYGMLAFQLPIQFQTNFHIDYSELSGIRGEQFEQIRAALNIPSVTFLKVSNVMDHNMDYLQFFPNLRILDVQVDKNNEEAFFIGNALASIQTVRIPGVKILQFDANLEQIALSRIYVSNYTEIRRAPASVEIIRE